jgi:hypothetical protein
MRSDEPAIEAVVGEPWTVAMGTDDVVDKPVIEAVVGEPWTVAMGTDEVVDEPVIAEQDGRYSLSFHRGEKATRAVVQPDLMSAGSLSKMSSFSVGRLYFQSAAKGFLSINYTTLYSIQINHWIFCTNLTGYK